MRWEGLDGKGLGPIGSERDEIGRIGSERVELRPIGSERDGLGGKDWMGKK